MSRKLNDNIRVLAPKPIDDREGVIQGGVWRPYNNVAEFYSLNPVELRYAGQSAKVLKDDGSIGSFSLSSNKTTLTEIKPTLTKEDVGLSKVQDLSPAEMPVSDATQSAINLVNSGIIVAIASTSPVPNVNIYKASVAATYTNLGGIVVSPQDLLDGDVRILRNSTGAWSKEIIPVADLINYAEKTSVELINGTPVSPSTVVDNFYVDYSNGNQLPNNGYITRIYPINESQEYNVTAKIQGGVTAMAVYYNPSMGYLGYQNKGTSTSVDYSNVKLTPPLGTSFVAISSNGKSATMLLIHLTGITLVKDKVLQQEEEIQNINSTLSDVIISVDKNTIDISSLKTVYGIKSPVVDGLEEYNGFYYTKGTGALVSNGGYYAIKVPVQSTPMYVTTKYNAVNNVMAVFFNSQGQYIGQQNPSTATANITWIDELIVYPTGTAFVGITSTKTQQAKPIASIISGYKPLPFVYNPLLFGKIVGAVGDSITQASLASDITDGILPLSGQAKKSHWYYIARRTGLQWHNYGISGSTLGDIFAEGSDKNGFSKSGGRYTQMADNLDYIPIMFGTNDFGYGYMMVLENYIQNKYGSYLKFPRSVDLIGQTGYFTQSNYDEVRGLSGLVDDVNYTNTSNWAYAKALYIGTINDTTNKTWYGAWNIVLPYLINKYPLAKILIWFTPTTDMFQVSTKKICEKWGIPYLDLQEENKPLVWYKPTPVGGWGLVNGVSVQTVRKNTFTSDGTHPNDVGYEYLSNPIQDAIIKI